MRKPSNDIVDLIVTPPNFRTTLFDNPKEMYDCLCEFEKNIHEGIKKIEQMKVISNMFITEAQTSKLEGLNNSIREQRRAIRNLSDLLYDIRRIKKDYFEYFFFFKRETDCRVPHFVTRNGQTHLFDNKETFLKCERSYLEEFDQLPTITFDPNKYIGFANFLRFYSATDPEYADLPDKIVVLSQDTFYDEIAIELKNGKWVYSRYYFPDE